MQQKIKLALPGSSYIHRLQKTGRQGGVPVIYIIYIMKTRPVFFPPTRACFTSDPWWSVYSIYFSSDSLQMHRICQADVRFSLSLGSPCLLYLFRRITAGYLRSKCNLGMHHGWQAVWEANTHKTCILGTSLPDFCNTPVGKEHDD